MTSSEWKRSMPHHTTIALLLGALPRVGRPARAEDGDKEFFGEWQSVDQVGLCSMSWDLMRGDAFLSIHIVAKSENQSVGFSISNRSFPGREAGCV